MKIIIRDSFKEDYISRQAGEKLRLMIIQAIKEKSELILDFDKLVVASTSFFDEGIAKLVDTEVTTEQFLKFIKLINLNKNDSKVLKQVNEYRKFNLENKPSHPWRLCPVGEHWVSEHNRTSKNGVVTIVDGHCRKSPGGKDIIKAEELDEIAKKHFKNLKTKVSENALQFKDGNSYNEIISGWCDYWNEVLEAKVKIHPNIVKALIASESGFDNNPKAPIGHKAIGLMQIMPETIVYLGVNGKELKDHFLEIKEDDVKNPNINIAAGIRWLFRKYELTEKKLKRVPTWKEVLYDYKGFTKSKTKLAQTAKSSLTKYLEELGE